MKKTLKVTLTRKTPNSTPKKGTIVLTKRSPIKPQQKTRGSKYAFKPAKRA